jgi:hypothetical protein
MCTSGICERLGVRLPGPTRPRGEIPRAYAASSKAAECVSGDFRLLRVVTGNARIESFS